MRSVVTGVAGFIGSHLAEHLLAAGHDVLGIDCFSPYYDAAIKRANIRPLLGHPRFQLVEADLTTADLPPLLEGAVYVFHLAGQPGVRGSWGKRFAGYLDHNVLATQRLLDALRGQSVRKLVFASSSSVYGNTPAPMRESVLPAPISPYGVTKLAAEHLCHLYHAAYGLPVVMLRYFTVYGPRQRPDMAIHRFIRAIACDTPITLYGDGSQVRAFTYVDDIVRANLLAACSPVDGATINVGGGTPLALRDLLDTLQGAMGRPAHLIHARRQDGDADHTVADGALARDLLGFTPQVGIEEGLRHQTAWQLANNHGAC